MELPINQVVEGDCLEVLPTFPDKSIDMILCDLPYGTTACKWDTIIPFELLWKEYKRLIKDNGAIVLTASQPFTSALVMSNPKWFKYCWVWDKVSPTGHLNAKKQPMRKTEDVCVFYCQQPVYNAQGLIWNPRVKTRSSKTEGSNCYGKHNDRNISEWQGYPTNVLKVQNENGFHPTQKPVALFEYLVKTYTSSGDIVLDNCAGSGTTGVACVNTTRNFVLIEKESEYCDIANKRIEQAKEGLVK